ncbi:hypothetical protein RAY_261 [Erwinia phage vB_EamM_RAY]|uniref:Uncharacterized protein n=1 Tax=Erwinia phage vB_EamM_RAY TaxID=1815987 RepID=A0A173GEB6_9CAUD|nr:hypothetical protein FDH98_gp257 [Erwinia phage vB_EamM_RAY]ANH52041.1 hypothetical protein RAY_261 [Erwinia phage vB_EamM_RAY]
MKYVYTIIAVLGFSFASVAVAADQTKVVKGWYAEYNTASVLYSAGPKKGQELTMECVLGGWTFAYADKMGEEVNSVDDDMTILVDGAAFAVPKTQGQREKLYAAIQHAKSGIQYKTHAYGVSVVFPVDGLAEMFRDLPFEVSPCMS